MARGRNQGKRGKPKKKINRYNPNNPNWNNVHVPWANPFKHEKVSTLSGNWLDDLLGKGKKK